MKAAINPFGDLIKRLISSKISLFLLLILSVQITAQSYLPMLDAPRQWHLTTCFSGCSNDIYFTNGDTTLQGLTYKVLDGFHYISRTFLFREELTNQKVFLSYPAGAKGNEEVLMYDFSLTVGDSFNMKNPITPFPADGGIYILDSIIPKVLLDGLNHRFYYFSPSNTNSDSQLPIWVEGIGSLSLINAPGGTPDVNGAGKISCHFRNGTLLYSQLDSISDCSFSTLKIDDNQEVKIAIYPTLVKDNFTIEGLDLHAPLEIRDGQGRLIMTHTIDKSSDAVYLMQVSNLKKGLYFIHVMGKHLIPATFKFIKI
jgi:hypothetical protein